MDAGGCVLLLVLLLVDGLQGRLHAVVLRLGRHYHHFFEFLECRLLLVLDDLQALDQLFFELLELLSLLFKFVN